MTDFGPSNFRAIKSKYGFSLVELLVVLTVAGILAAFAAPTLLTLKSTNLSTSGQEFGGFLNFCRSKAIAERTSVRMAVVIGSSDPEDAYRKYAGWEWDKKTEDYVRFSEWRFLPVFLEFENRVPEYVFNSSYAETERSVVEGDYVLTDEFQNKAVVEMSKGESLTIQYITFSPSGRASVEGGEKRNLILVIREATDAKTQQQTKNWYQYTLDTLTGRFRIYRP